MPVHPPQLALDKQLCFALYDASRAFIRAYGPLLEPLGLTYPQYVAMLALWEASEPVTVGTLGDRLGLDSGTLTPLLKRLEQSGLVERRRDTDDERRVLVTPTLAGRALREAATDIPGRLQARLQLDIPTMRTLHQQLVELAAAVKRATEPAGADRGGEDQAHAGSGHDARPEQGTARG
jgi:MarR family transcriptional regulator, organic hydroperoxide resistance regulator